MGLPWIFTSGLMQYQNDFRCYFFKIASKPFSSLRSEDLNVTQSSWNCCFFPFIKKTSMVTADIFTGRVYILRRRGILQFTLSLESDIHIQLQHGLHVRNFLRLFDTELSYVALNSVNILLPFSNPFLVFSETRHVVREFSLS